MSELKSISLEQCVTTDEENDDEHLKMKMVDLVERFPKFAN